MTPEERAEAVILWMWGPSNLPPEHDGRKKLRSAIAAAIREAVDEEREACAKCAMEAFPPAEDRWQLAGEHIAEEIRARGQHNTTPCAEAANQPQE